MRLEDLKQTNFKQKNASPVFYLADGTGYGGIPLLKFHLYQELEKSAIIEHGFTTREGGVSKGIYASLNLSYARGDERAAVDENFRRAAVSLHADVSDFVLTDQTHTVNVRKATGADRGKGIVKALDYHDIDGLHTDEPGIVLAAFFADCVPLFFVDMRHHAVGVAHSGWRGTVSRMGRVMVEAMRAAYGSSPDELLCAVGPSICQSCYEVSEDVAQRFAEEFPGAGPELCVPTVHGKYQLDLWKANEIVLREAGVVPEHLAVTNICTCCNPSQFFSHRASQGRRGNLGAFIKLCRPGRA